MSAWVRLGALEDIRIGGAKAMEVNGHCMAVFRLHQGIFVLEGNCRHQGVNLAEGKIEGTRVTCPRQECRFDIVSGACLTNRDIQLGTYRVKVKGTDILVRFP